MGPRSAKITPRYPLISRLELLESSPAQQWDYWKPEAVLPDNTEPSSITVIFTSLVSPEYWPPIGQSDIPSL